MATIEVENLIQQLQPKYLQELRQFIDYLLFVQNNQAAPNGKAKQQDAPTASKPAEPEEENVPERLRVLRQYRGIAPEPHFPMTKYDVYEQ
ncbi:MAG: hypothetical protein IPN76_25060 [Saprospiraceae bacterium]|nr:hypothetical protein [Saprospiraceae bacterium]